MRSSLSSLADSLSEIKDCKKIDKKLLNDLIEKSPNTYKFWNGYNNKFELLFRKGVYPYEYMDSCDRFNETSLPSKKIFIMN